MLCLQNTKTIPEKVTITVAEKNHLPEMDKKLKFVGIFCTGDLSLDFLYRHLKVFKLRTILFDAAGGGVMSHSSKSPGYCYMKGRIRIQVCLVL